jgi:hypothetical protein
MVVTPLAVAGWGRASQITQASGQSRRETAVTSADQSDGHSGSTDQDLAQAGQMTGALTTSQTRTPSFSHPITIPFHTLGSVK